jgi:hypothetical protein
MKPLGPLKPLDFAQALLGLSFGLAIVGFLFPVLLAFLPPLGISFFLYFVISELLFLFFPTFGPYHLRRIPWNAALASKRFLPPANIYNTTGAVKPANLTGIWHLRGNPLPVALMSLAGSVYRPESGALWFKVYDGRCWTFHGNVFGWLLYLMVWLSGLEYEIMFDAVGWTVFRTMISQPD